jgi:rubredoxin
MKIANDRRICVKCKVEKSIFDYNIEWVEKNWEISYVRRVCRKCEAGRRFKKIEERELNKKLSALNKKRLKLQLEIDNCQITIDETLTQIDQLAQS